MSVGMQVAMAGAIGGTAEALGGGKFANGAVTGAYVMMFNHFGGEFPSSGKELPPEKFYFNNDIFEVYDDGSYLLWDNQWLKIPENGGTIAYRDGWDLTYETPEITISGIQQVKWDYTTSLLRRESIIGATWGGGVTGVVKTTRSFISWGLKGFSMTAIPPAIIGAVVGYSTYQFEVNRQMQLRMRDHNADVLRYRNYHLNNK